MTAPECSRPVDLRDVPPQGTEMRFEATPEECAALARRFGLLSLSAFSGRVEIKPWRKAGLALKASFTAEVSQPCVVTLEPAESRIKEDFELHLLPPDLIEQADAEAPEREVVIDVRSEDSPEPLEGDEIDVGEIFAEQLALAIDPYPRKPGAVFELPPDESEAALKPFAALEILKKGQ